MPIDAADLSIRTERLDALLEERGLAAVWFARPNSFAWLTGGSNVVSRAGEVGVAAAGYVASDGGASASGTAGDEATAPGASDSEATSAADPGRLLAVTDNVERRRLLEEELPDDFAVESSPWHETSLAEAVADRSPTPAAADFDVPGCRSLDPSALRQPLTDGDVQRYRALGADATEAVESVCRAVDPADTEREVATAVRASLGTRGVDAPVVLVGGASRARRYRHFTPTDAELGGYALVSVTAERGGLHASLTRTVAFDPPEWLEDRHRVAARVEATALGATRAAAREGGDAGDVFGAIRDAYERLGHEGEWRKHHQGGAAGYAGREWIATPSADDRVFAPMAYAWNPTVRGAKSEDTVLVAPEGFEVLTATGEWPAERVEGIDGTALDRHQVLDRSGTGE